MLRFSLLVIALSAVLAGSAGAVIEPPATAPVPEPSAALLFAAGLAFLLRGSRRMQGR
jgi:hypothetical protein